MRLQQWEPFRGVSRWTASLGWREFLEETEGPRGEGRFGAALAPATTECGCAQSATRPCRVHDVSSRPQASNQPIMISPDSADAC